jgi:penicillin amidase
LARDALVAELDRAIEEMGSPGTHPDLMAVVDGLDDETKDMLRSSRDRLAAWTLETPAALEGEPTAAEVADSVASTIFNVAFGRIARLLLNDEYAVLGRGANHDERIMLWSLTDADSLATYDSDLGDTVLWDDLATEDRQETRGEMVVRGFAMALGWLSSELGATMEDWRWGELHTVRFDSIVPTLGDNPISIPPEGSDRFPNGFPRHGDRGVVDASSFGLFGACECEGDSCSIYDGCDPRRSDFAYGSGPQQRLVVEMTPEGPNAWNAMPGGQVLDPMSEHHADEAELWRMNEAPPVYFTDEDVEAHAEETFTIEAAP